MSQAIAKPDVQRVDLARAAIERFDRSFLPEALTGCWLWLGPLNQDGYSRFFALGKRTTGHRFSYERFVGRIPGGLVIDHKCRNRSCVNPDHLEAVTNDENMRRGHHATKKFCKHGHPFDGDNTRLVPRKNGRHQRACRTCERNVYTPKVKRMGRRWGK